MNLDDLLKSIREENGDSKGGKIDPDKLIQRRTYKAPAKFSSQSFRAPSIKPTPSRKLDADKLAPTETIQVGKDFLDKIDELIQVIKEDNELEKDRQDALDKEKARERRQTRENRIEVGKIFSGFTKGFKRVTGQFNDIINTVIRFLAFTVLGGLVKFLFDFLRNPKNKNFLKEVQKFFTVTLPQKFQEAKQKLGEVIKFFEETVPKIQAFAENFRQLLARFPFLGDLFKTKEEKKEQQERRQGQKEYGGGLGTSEPFSGLFSGGGMISMGTDTVPALLTPGEFIMSRGAVSMFGADTMMAMNKAGGGTNRPKFGLVSGYQGGGIVNDEYSEAHLARHARAAGYKDKELAAFLAQMAHETGNFRYRREISGGASHYGGGGPYTLPNGKVVPAKYHGRGYVQLTHDYNYRKYGDKIGVDLLNNPELATSGDIAAKVAIEYWKDTVRPMVKGNWDNVFLHSAAINYPAARNSSQINGYQDRVNKYNNYLKKISSGEFKSPQSPPVIPVGPHFGPGFDSSDRAQSERLDLIELMQKNRAQQRAARSDINLDRLFNPIRRFFGVDKPNVPTSNSFMVLPTIDQPSDTAPTTQIATDIPEFDIVSGANMRGLYSQVLGIEDLT